MVRLVKNSNLESAKQGADSKLPVISKEGGGSKHSKAAQQAADSKGKVEAMIKMVLAQDPLGHAANITDSERQAGSHERNQSHQVVTSSDRRLTMHDKVFAHVT